MEKWLNDYPTTDETLDSISKLEVEDYDKDPKFIASFMKGMLVEDILRAMEEDNISKSELAEMLGKSRQYVGRILNETANFTVDTIAQMACALGRQVEVRIYNKNETLKISNEIKSCKKM